MDRAACRAVVIAVAFVAVFALTFAVTFATAFATEAGASRAGSAGAKAKVYGVPHQLAPAVAPGATPSPPPQLSVSRDRPADKLPFWRKRRELMKKIREDREIVVSVKREELDSPKDFIRFTMLGAGAVSRPKGHCFRVSQQYSRLREVSDHFKTVSYNASSGELFLITEALGYQARMILRMVPVSEDWRSELQWEVIWGHFKGMKGTLGFEELSPRETEVSIQANYEASELPLPKVLMGFALEVVVRKVAEKMRSFIESQPQLSQTPEVLAPAAMAPATAAATATAAPKSDAMADKTPDVKPSAKPPSKSKSKEAKKENASG